MFMLPIKLENVPSVLLSPIPQPDFVHFIARPRVAYRPRILPTEIDNRFCRTNFLVTMHVFGLAPTSAPHDGNRRFCLIERNDFPLVCNLVRHNKLCIHFRTLA